VPRAERLRSSQRNLISTAHRTLRTCLYAVELATVRLDSHGSSMALADGDEDFLDEVVPHALMVPRLLERLRPPGLVPTS